MPKTPRSCSQLGYLDMCLIRDMLGVDVGQGLRLEQYDCAHFLSLSHRLKTMCANFCHFVTSLL